MNINPNSRYLIWGKNSFHDFLGIELNVSTILSITFDDCSNIRVSKNHLFEKIAAKDLKIGDILDNKVVKSIIEDGAEYVYDPIEVEGHLYEANGVTNHNCSFIGSSKTLVNSEVIEKLVEKDPIKCLKNYTFNIYEDPIPGVLYLIGCDIAAGTSNDYSVIQVIRVLDDKHFRQVAVYADNTINPISFAREIREISKLYNNAQTVVESNGPGAATINELWFNLEFETLVNTDKKELGTKSTRKTKLDACLNLKVIMEEKRLELYDSATIKEMTQFIEITPNVFAADKGCHDDRVCALYWALYATTRMEVDMSNSGESVESVSKDDDDKRLDAFYDEYNENPSDDLIWKTIS